MKFKKALLCSALTIFFSAVSAHSADFDDAIFSHYADGAFHDSNSFSDYNTVIINRLSDDKVCVSSAVFCYRAWP